MLLYIGIALMCVGGFGMILMNKRTNWRRRITKILL